MNPLLWIRLALGVALLAAIAFAIHWVDANYYGRQMAEKERDWQTKQTMLANANAAWENGLLTLRKNAEVQHGKDQDSINHLAGQLGSLRIHIPSGSCTGTGIRPAGTGENGSAGLLPDTVDAAFADFQAKTGRLIQRCDQLNIDAIQQNGEIGQ